MKKRISATIDNKTDKILNLLIKEEDYRNKSHIIDKAIKFLWREKYGKDKK